MLDLNALPSHQEPLKVSNRDRLNLSPETVQGEPMNPSQQSTVTPFEFVSIKVKFASENKPLGFQRNERGIDFSNWDLKKTGELSTGCRTGYFHATPHEFSNRIRSLPLPFAFGRRRNKGRINFAIGVNGP
jgi:hypothetical protein